MKYILITGASRGIGFETARILAADGHHVIATARSGNALRKLKSKFPDRINILPADLTNQKGLSNITSFLKSEEILLDGLIHNAGLLINKPFKKLNDSDWQAMLDINLMAPVRLTKSLLPFMEFNSHILAISSMGGFQQSKKFAGLTGYSATKGALSILAECLSVELADKNIHSNCLCLGAVQTEMFEKAFPGMTAPVSAEYMGNYIAEFVLNGHLYYNGKVLPVSLSDPD
ncbi:MAG: SDR family oxidoreductase [Balneolaceae bacterium]